VDEKVSSVSNYLYKIIQEGEHQQQYFKFCISDSRKIARTLVAFANTDGGRLLVGVKDNGRIAGVRSDEEIYMVEAAASMYSKPAIAFTTRQWSVEGKTVLEITIEPSKEKPHFAHDETGKWLAFIRIKDENCLANKIQLNVWNGMASTVGIHFSISEPEKILIDFLEKHGSITFSKFMRIAHISSKAAEKILTDFVLMDVLIIQTTLSGTNFILNKQILEENLKFRKME